MQLGPYEQGDHMSDRHKLFKHARQSHGGERVPEVLDLAHFKASGSRVTRRDFALAQDFCHPLLARSPLRINVHLTSPESLLKSLYRIWVVGGGGSYCQEDPALPCDEAAREPQLCRPGPEKIKMQDVSKDLKIWYTNIFLDNIIHINTSRCLCIASCRACGPIRWQRGFVEAAEHPLDLSLGRLWRVLRCRRRVRGQGWLNRGALESLKVSWVLFCISLNDSLYTGWPFR